MEECPAVAVEQKDNTADNQLNALIIQIGQFGRYQIINYVMLCLPIFFISSTSFSYVFTSGNVHHRCDIPQCDSANSSFIEPWLNFTTPESSGTWSSCEQYAAVPGNEFNCDEEQFNSSHIVPCEAGYKFVDKENTIATEFNLHCQDESLLSFARTASNLGSLVGVPIGGYMSDRYGRKTTLVVAGVFSAFAGLAVSHAIGFYSFISLQFLTMVISAPIYSCAFLLAIELVGPKHRLLVSTIVNMNIGLGKATLGYLAKYLLDWRDLLRAVYTPALLHLLLICYIPESVRWLLSRSKELEVLEMLRRAARVNRREVTEAQLSELLRANRKMLAESSACGGHYSMRQVFGALRLRILICSLLFMGSQFINISLILNSMELQGNKFYNFIFLGFMQLPAELLAPLIMHRIGRRWGVCLSFSLSSLLLLIFVAVDWNHFILSRCLYLVASLFAISSGSIIYFFTTEIFPTNCRHRMLAFLGMIARIGSTSAQYITLLLHYYKYAPHLLLAVIGLICAVLPVFLPDTANCVLPTTLEEAKAMDKPTQKPTEQTKSV